MKPVILAFLLVCLCLGSAIAQDLGNSRELPVKNTPVVTYEPPAVPKQGGDTIQDAYPIVGLPFTDTGTTAGYNNDYDEACPYTDSTAPDVVYSFTPDSDVHLKVDLCGSGYDTKLYIYGTDLNLIACNDDTYFDDDCGVYVSAIEEAVLLGGETYFIVIDGFGGEFGDYVLLVEEFEPCIFVGCPDDAVLEGEPPLHDGYEDAYNGGCSSPEFSYPLQAIDWTNDEDGVPPYDGTAWLCGKSGWYLNPGGHEYRDTDWFRVYALETGMMEFAVETEYPCYLFVKLLLDCWTGIDFMVTADCEEPGTLTVPVTTGQEIWMWVGPTTFTGPVTEFTYFLTVTNNTFDTVPNEAMSWGQVKSLYR
jgi:hypothetical protein